MTVEERARELFFSMDKVLDVKCRKTVITAFEQALRDQIEECAKVAKDRDQEIGDMLQDYEPDTYIYNRGVTQIDECNLIEDRIRALAAPKEENEIRN